MIFYAIESDSSASNGQRIMVSTVMETGIVELDGEWVVRIVEKPTPEEAPSNVSSLPMYCFGQTLLGYLPEIELSPRGEYELQDAIQMLIEREGRVRGVWESHGSIAPEKGKRGGRAGMR